ncbi:MAG: phage tail tape measure protein [Eubacterium sp.]|jgi:TP901 family phage tail tape measure protein|nr:phage tail tape measure protein [Eubacterium sp.]
MGMDSVFRLSVVMGMQDNLTAPLSGVTDSVTNTTKKLDDAFGTVQKAGAALAGVGAGITTACIATVTSTFDTQDALGELSSLGVTDLKAVEDAAKSFSDTWAGTTKSDFITASYDIKSGIASLTDEGVAQFTELAALTGKATKSTTEEMGSLFATGYGIYKGAYDDMSDLEFGEMFSAGISTAVKNYKTAGSEMASSISTLGATATNNKVPLEEQLAILGQLQTTMSGSEAATKYKAFLNAAASAGDKLKLSFVDANNQLLSTPEILEKLKGKYGDTIDAVEKQQIKEAFGTDEAVAMIDLLYSDIDGLSGGIDSMAESMKKGTAVTTEMAEAINNTPAQKFQVLKQQIHNNVEELGNGLLPVVNETMDKVSGVIQKGSEWISNNQKTVQSIMNIALKLGIILTVLGTVIGVVGTVGKAVLAAKNAITAVKGAWTVLSGAFAASPVGWVVIGIVALVAAFVLLWNKSEAFRNFWIGLFEKVKGAVQNAWSTLQPALQNLGQKLIGLYEAAKPILKVIGTIAGVIGTYFVGTFVGAIQGVLAALTPLTNALSSLVSFVTNIINAIVALFKGDFGGACDFLIAAVDNVKDFFINGFDAILSFIGGFVDGFLNVVGGALDAVGIDASGTISKIKSTVSNGLNAVKGFFGNIMGAAADTAKQKLSNIKSAYEANGGGIKGVVAASQEAVKGYFTAGLSFIDNLTGGKLTAIKNKFTDGLNGAKNAVTSVLDNIKSGFQSKLDAAHAIVTGVVDKIKGVFNFNWKLPELKLPHISVTGGEAPFGIAGKGSLPKFDIQWYAEGGVMTAPTIFGAAGGKLLGGGEAGDEAILPLSALWDKLKVFIHNEMDQDEDKSRGSVGSVISALTRKETRTLESKEKVSERDIQELKSGNGKGNTIIQKLEIRVDVEKIKDLPMLFKLIDEIKDAQNSTDEPVTA